MTWVAAKLCNEGFPILHIGRNQKNPKYMVYQFADTPELRMALATILADEVKIYGRERTENDMDRST